MTTNQGLSHGQEFGTLFALEGLSECARCRPMARSEEFAPTLSLTLSSTLSSTLSRTFVDPEQPANYKTDKV